MEKVREFLCLLFKPDETACFARTVYETAVLPQVACSVITEEYSQFTINPIRDRRCDANVSSHRTFLVEMDSIPLGEQDRVVEEIGMPFTSKVFSGNRSYHYLIVLAEDLPNRAHYDLVVDRLFRAVPYVDPANRNPSRFTRYPGAIRPDTGKIQELVELRDRVSLYELEAWLAKRGAPAGHGESRSRGNYPTATYRRPICGFVKNMLMFGVRKGERNSSIFKAACFLLRDGYSVEEVESLLEPLLATDDFRGFPKRELMCCIQSASRKVLDSLASMATGAESEEC